MTPCVAERRLHSIARDSHEMGGAVASVATRRISNSATPLRGINPTATGTGSLCEQMHDTSLLRKAGVKTYLAFSSPSGFSLGPARRQKDFLRGSNGFFLTKFRTHHYYYANA